MIRCKKIFTLVVFSLCFLPITTAFCCCTDSDPNLSRREMLGHHEYSEHHHDHDRHDKSSSDSCECGHELLGDVNNQTINIPGFNFSSQLLHQYFFISESAVLASHNHDFRFNDAGPPGHFAATPLYLQLSILRI